MTRQIRFNAFDMNCVAHQSPGLWTHPRDRSWQYKDVEYWTGARSDSNGESFDGIFIADVIGYYDVYKGNNFHAIQQAAQIPLTIPCNSPCRSRWRRNISALESPRQPRSSIPMRSPGASRRSTI